MLKCLFYNFFEVCKMSYPFPSDLLQMVQTHLSTGRYSSEDELLRDALQALAAREEDYVAIQQAIDEWKNGDDGVPLGEAFDRLRKRPTNEHSK